MWLLKIKEKEKLLVLKISDTLTLNELSDFLIEIYDKHAGKYATFDRFVDMSSLREIKIDFDIFSFNVNRYRRLINLESPVKISLFIPENYVGGFPHLYKSMLSNEQFKIEIFDSLDDCAEYLSADKKLLEESLS